MKKKIILALISTVSISALAAGPFKPIEVKRTEYKDSERRLSEEELKKLSLKNPNERSISEKSFISSLVEKKIADLKTDSLPEANDLSTAARNFSGVLDIILNRINIIVDKSTKTEAKEVAQTELKLASEIGKLDAMDPKAVKAAETLAAIINMPAEKASIRTFKNNLLSKLQNKKPQSQPNKPPAKTSDG
jgi:hypothetical protein